MQVFVVRTNSQWTLVATTSRGGAFDATHSAARISGAVTQKERLVPAEGSRPATTDLMPALVLRTVVSTPKPTLAATSTATPEPANTGHRARSARSAHHPSKITS